MTTPRRIQQQPAFILHHRPFRDSSQILDIVTRDYGKIALVARGSRGSKSRLAGLLRPFSPLRISWVARSDLGTLTGAESAGNPLGLHGDAILSAFYVNELLLNFLHRHDPQPEIYGLYAEVIRALGSTSNFSRCLRMFELEFLGLLGYAGDRHPNLRRHLSVQASAANPETIRFYHDQFGVKRVVLPRVLTVDEIARINKAVPVETEVFAFGGLCVMAEGRCLLSSYATGESPNMNGVCSPAEHVRYEDRNGRLVSHLGKFAINTFAAGEPAGYPTLCKGRFRACDRDSYLFEEPTSLDAIRMLPALTAAGVTALKIEGRQRGKAYVAQVVAAFRAAVDAVARGEDPPPVDLGALTEGGRQTTGAYEKTWR